MTQNFVLSLLRGKKSGGSYLFLGAAVIIVTATVTKKTKFPNLAIFVPSELVFSFPAKASGMSDRIWWTDGWFLPALRVETKPDIA